VERALESGFIAMAPLPKEPLSAFIERARAQVADGHPQVCFGGHHWDMFALCVEDGRFRVRQMAVNQAAHEAFLAAHGSFMPENTLAVSKPGALVIEAATLRRLFLKMRMPWNRGRWGLA